jgi:hypothetical protein
MPTDPTPYADVNALLDLLLSRMRTVLGEELVGLYLYGSLAAGDFDRDSSDIDFVAATAGEPDEREVAQLERMHEEIAASGGPWGGRLEGAYLSLAALRRYDPNHRQPFLSPRFRVTALGADWVINRYVLREKGIVIAGPSPASLINPITPEELIDAVRQSCKEWSAYLDAPEVMRTRTYQAFTILTMCRALYALDRGEFVSKPAAARWAEEHLGPEWTALIRRALASRHDERADDAALPETLRFLRFALGRCYSISQGH